MNKFICKYILNHYEYISFDIFDTLIERDVNRTSDIFMLVGKKVLGEEKAEEFRELRKRAECNAREENQSSEITLEHIYKKMNGIYNQSVIESLKNEEIKTELEHCYIKDNMASFYATCIKHKKVLIVSDMYLSADVIHKMLEKCNVKGYESLFVSSEYGVNKISGKLFNIVMDQKKIHASQMIHIGDSIKADFLGARKVGIKSILIGRKNRLKRLIHS